MVEMDPTRAKPMRRRFRQYASCTSARIHQSEGMTHHHRRMDRFTIKKACMKTESDLPYILPFSYALGPSYLRD